MNTYTLDDQVEPRVAGRNWRLRRRVAEPRAERGHGRGIFGQRVDASGERVGDEFLVNEVVAGDQFLPDVAGAGGRFLVVWSSFDSVCTEIIGRRLEIGLFADRVESGDVAGLRPLRRPRRTTDGTGGQRGNLAAGEPLTNQT